MIQSLDGVVSIVTGASSGIGEATAHALAARGAAVVVAARRAERLASVVEAIAAAGGRGIAVPTDVRDRDAVGALVARAVKEHGRLDVLVNAAGVMPLGPMTPPRFDEWDEVIDVNVRGVLHAVGHALPIMLSQGAGHVVNVSSVAGRQIFPAATVYSATKHAVHAISEGLRGELAALAKRDGNRVRVTVIAPGVVRTALPETIRHDATRAASEAYYDSFAEPLTAADVADAILHAVTAPSHVGLNEIVMRPAAQVR